MPNRIKRWFFDQMAAWCVLFRRRDLALEYYGRMLELDPGDPLALASIALPDGAARSQAGGAGGVRPTADGAPEDAEAHFNRGFLLQDMNDREGAMAAFRRAIALNPDHDRAHYGLALSLISARRLEEALVPLKKNTKLQPMSPYGWYQLARVQHELGRTDETQQVLDHLARFEPKIARQLERETGLRASTLS